MLIVAGKIYVDPSGREDYLDGCAEVVELARAADGCLDFAITADLLEPGRINVYERWETDAQLEAFRGSGPSQEQNVAMISAEVAKYRISAVESP